MKMLLNQCRKGTWLFGLLALLALAACGTNANAASTGTNNAVTPQKSDANSFTFNLVPSPNITKCLPHAGGSVTITPNNLNDEMTVHVTGLAPNAEYDLFVIEIPNAPFGVSWYQSDLDTNGHGEGSVSVRGIFDKETFSVSPGGPTTTFKPVHQYHLGLWFNDPQLPFNLGCEPGKTSPVVTPFNGEQHAGIQVLNTSNFPDAAGPLSKVTR